MAIRSIRLLILGSLVFVVMMLAFSSASFAQIGISVTFGPPALPEYDQPACPGEGYIWTPGYWAYDSDVDDYYWVPGTWVMAPEPGLLWTPAYWAWNDNRYVFYDGYWGPEVGFYGGINYGFGYFGDGYEGGRWDHGQFFYNRSVNNINVTNIRNVYNAPVSRQAESRVSYNGGNGGITARPTAQQEAVARQRHVPPVAAQTQHVQAARGDTQLRASVNRGKPAVAATPKAGDLRGQGVVQAKAAGGTYTPPANRAAQPRPNAEGARAENNAPRPQNDARPTENNNAARPNAVVHPNDIPKREAPAPVNSGNAKADQKYQQQQQKLASKQDQERQKLQQKQDKDHQQLEQKKANDTQKQQVEQRHQQQTQKLQQKHDQQQQKMQARAPQQQPARAAEAKPPKGKS